ncbi:MAG TPA: copper resistance protein CopC [Nocardioides sp.]|nr:copper resistance protein CopC [Nocardioides sp.]
MRCSQAREALSAWYDGEPADADPATVDSHLDTCTACTAYRRGLSSIADLAVPASPPAGLAAALLADGRLRVTHQHGRLGGGAKLVLVLTALVALAVVALLALGAGPVSAHAVLEGSNPEADAILPTPPTSVDLTFNEAITLLPDSIRVYGPDGSTVGTGSVAHSHGDGATAAVALRGDLPDGTYLVSYRVVSADSHPIEGAYTFAVGHFTRTPTELAGGGSGSNTVDVGLGLARWLSYAGSALGLGGFAFLVWCWPAGWASRRARLLVSGGVAVLIVGTLLALLLKGPYDEGSGLGSVTDGPALRQVLATTYGHALDARLLLIALLVLLLTYRDHLPRPALLAAPAVLLVGTGVTFALCGHAAAGGHRPLAVASDTLHVAAMSIWLGGLVMLLGAVLVSGRREEATPPVLRFSTLATAAVTGLIATGIYQTLREVRSWDVFLHTHYGHVLVVKLGIVGLAFLAAASSRTWVWQTVNPVVTVHAATEAPPGPVVDGRPALRRLRRSVGVETLLLIGVLAASAMLVTSDPARSAEPSGPITRSIAVGPDHVRVTAVPDGSRRVKVTLQVTDAAGKATEPKEVDAMLTLTSEKIGPLPVTLDAMGHGMRMGEVSVPVPGDWQLAVTVRTSAIDEATGYVDVPIE